MDTNHCIVLSVSTMAAAIIAVACLAAKADSAIVTASFTVIGTVLMAVGGTSVVTTIQDKIASNKADLLVNTVKGVLETIDKKT